jgi:DNA invertase Pin-like site-specific DNA recombinase
MLDTSMGEGFLACTRNGRARGGAPDDRGVEIAAILIGAVTVVLMLPGAANELHTWRERRARGLSSLSESVRLEDVNLAGIPEPRKRRRRGVAAPRAEGMAAVYVRVSTAEQADPGLNGGSLESQEARCRALCEARGLSVARIFIDAGASGGSLERPALDELRASVEAGHVAAVVVYAVDRLSRSQADTLTLLQEFEQHGAGLMAASQDFDTTSPTGRAMLGMLAVFAELQRAEIRERTKAKLRAKRGRGEAVGRAAFGLKRDGAGFARDPETWPTLARILQERGEGRSCQAIADDLNRDGMPTPTAARGEARGLVAGPGRWHAATVAKLCRNPHVLSAAKTANGTA